MKKLTTVDPYPPFHRRALIGKSPVYPGKANEMSRLLSWVKGEIGLLSSRVFPRLREAVGRRTVTHNTERIL